MPLNDSLPQIGAADEAVRLAAIRAYAAARYYYDNPEGRTAREVVYKMLAILGPAMPAHVIEAADAINAEGL
jgi:hypothetical protein